MVMQVCMGAEGALVEELVRRLGTQPTHLSHLSGGLFFFGGTLRNLLMILLPLLSPLSPDGPSEESVEKPDTSSSVSGAWSFSLLLASSANTESEPSERESGSGGSTLPIDASGAFLLFVGGTGYF